jgi:hypothetical protein
MRGAALSEHQDPRSEEYGAHQVSQRKSRAAGMGAYHQETVATLLAMEAAKAKLVAERSRKQEIEDFGVDFVINPQGAEMSVEDHRLTRMILNETRREYFEDKRWKKLRAYEYHLIYRGNVVRKAAKKEKLRDSDPKGAKWGQFELPPEKVPAIFYEAHTLNPCHSQGIVRACKVGHREAVLRLLKEIGVELARFMSENMGCEVAAIPFHAKDYAAHFQPSFVFVDSHGKKLGRRNQRHLGRALLGAYRLRVFLKSCGLSGAELDRAMDETTGFKGASEGLDRRLAERGDVAIDLKVAKWIDQKIEELLKHPDFKEIVPCFEEARSDYRAMKDADRRALVEAANREMSIEELEQQMETGAALAEARRAELLAKTSLAEAEQTKSAADEQEELVAIKLAELENEALVLRDESRQIALERELLAQERHEAIHEKMEVERRILMLAEDRAKMAEALRLSVRLAEIKEQLGQPVFGVNQNPEIFEPAQVAPVDKIYVLSPHAQDLLTFARDIDDEGLGKAVDEIIDENRALVEKARVFDRECKAALTITSKVTMAGADLQKLNRCRKLIDVDHMERAFDKLTAGERESEDLIWVSRPTLRQLDKIAAQFEACTEGTFAAAWARRLRSVRSSLAPSVLHEVDCGKKIRFPAAPSAPVKSSPVRGRNRS